MPYPAKSSLTFHKIDANVESTTAKGVQVEPLVSTLFSETDPARTLVASECEVSTYDLELALRYPIEWDQSGCCL